MMRRINNKIGLIIAMLIYAINFMNPLVVCAEEQIVDNMEKSFYGRLPVYVMDVDDISYLEVYKHNDNLYAKSTSFARTFGYKVGTTEVDVQFLQEINDECKWMYLSSFKVNSKAAWTSDGKSVNAYQAPVKTIENENGIWIPLQFAIKIMGREMVINSGIAVVSSAHEPIETAINNMDGVDTTFFKVLVESSKELEKSGEENIYTNPMLTEAIDGVMRSHGTQSSEDKIRWIVDGINTNSSSEKKEKDEEKKERIDELATYLVSNLGPENLELSKSYYESRLMYLDADYYEVAGGAITENLNSEFNEDTTYDEGKAIVEKTSERFVDFNAPTIKYNYAFDQAYSGLTGYSPLDRTWTDEIIYNDFFSSMIVYHGKPNDFWIESFDYFGGFLGEPGEYTASAISGLYAELRCAHNMFAESDYSSKRFDQYLSTISTHNVDEELIKSINDRILNYGDYQTKILQDASEIDIKSEVDEEIQDQIAEINPILNFIVKGGQFGKYIYTVNNVVNEMFFDNYKNYYLAAQFADEIQGNAFEDNNHDWAYLYYKTDYVAKKCISNLFCNPKLNEKISEESAAKLVELLSEVMSYDAFQLATIKYGVYSGLQPKDSKPYCNIYDDGVYINLIEKVDLVTGNSNGNINNCGFVATSTNYRFYVDSENGYYVNVVPLDKMHGEKFKIDEWAHWLNAYEIDGTDYLLFVDSSLDIKIFNCVTRDIKTASEGSYSNVMVGFGYVFAKEGDKLCRFQLTEDGLSDKNVIINGVGDCIAYDLNTVYYADTRDDVHSVDFDGNQDKNLGINSSSFDLCNGNLLYSDNSDSRSIHIYNVLTGLESKICSSENTYCLIYSNGFLYYKIDDGVSGGMLFSVVPLVDKAVTRIYTWKGPDNDWEASIKDNDVDSGRDERRLFNVSAGKIYNEGYFWSLSESPVTGINKDNILGYIAYRISVLFNE